MCGTQLHVHRESDSGMVSQSPILENEAPPNILRNIDAENAVNQPVETDERVEEFFARGNEPGVTFRRRIVPELSLIHI